MVQRVVLDVDSRIDDDLTTILVVRSSFMIDFCFHFVLRKVVLDSRDQVSALAKAKLGRYLKPYYVSPRTKRNWRAS